MGNLTEDMMSEIWQFDYCRTTIIPCYREAAGWNAWLKTNQKIIHASEWLEQLRLELPTMHVPSTSGPWWVHKSSTIYDWDTLPYGRQAKMFVAYSSAEFLSHMPLPCGIKWHKRSDGFMELRADEMVIPNAKHEQYKCRMEMVIPKEGDNTAYYFDWSVITEKDDKQERLAPKQVMPPPLSKMTSSALARFYFNLRPLDRYQLLSWVGLQEYMAQVSSLLWMFSWFAKELNTKTCFKPNLLCAVIDDEQLADKIDFEFGSNLFNKPAFEAFASLDEWLQPAIIRAWLTLCPEFFVNDASLWMTK